MTGLPSYYRYTDITSESGRTSDEFEDRPLLGDHTDRTIEAPYPSARAIKSIPEYINIGLLVVAVAAWAYIAYTWISVRLWYNDKGAREELCQDISLFQYSVANSGAMILVVIYIGMFGSHVPLSWYGLRAFVSISILLLFLICSPLRWVEPVNCRQYEQEPAWWMQ